VDPALLAAPAAAVAGLGGAHAVWRRAFGRPPAGLPAVLAYHKVGTAELGGTWCTRRQFAAHLDALHDGGYTVVDLAAFQDRLDLLCAGGGGAVPALVVSSGAGAASRARSEYMDVRAARVPSAAEARMAGAERPPQRPKTPPAREVLITFDDAWASFAAHAFPELVKRGFPASLFVVVDYVGQRAGWDLALPGRRALHLDWAALRALVAAGVEIGSHTATHRDLRRLTPAQLEGELAGSRRQLEDALGVRVRAVSYPFGRCDARVVDAAAAAGYRLGFAMCPPGPNARVGRFALRRWGVYVTDTPHAVLDKVDPARRGFWFQDLFTRGVHAVAALSARGTRDAPHRAGDDQSAG